MHESFSVLIPDGESGLALFVAHCLSNFPDVDIHVLSSDPLTPLRFSRYCKSFTFVRHDGEGTRFLEAIRETVARHKIQLVLPVDTPAISFAIDHRDALCEFVAVVPLPDRYPFDLANNKWLMARFLSANGIATPPCLLVDYSSAFFEGLKSLEFPVLLKPETSRGGDGIRRFNTLQALDEYMDRVPQKSVQGHFIVQTLLSGGDVSLNVLAQEGKILAMTVQKGIIPNTEKFGGPGALQFIDDERFTLAAQRLVAALPWSGYACVDTLCDARSKPYVLDINARFWASVRGSWVAGVSFPYLACLAALGIPFQSPDLPTTRYFHSKTAVRELIMPASRNRHRRGPDFRETDLRFLIRDPLAETLRIFNQEVLDK